VTAPEASRPQTLRPLALGEQLDAAIQIYKARWKPMVKAAALVTGPVFIFQAFVQASAGDANSLTEVDPETGFVTTDGRALALFLAASLIGLVITFISTAIATAGVFRMVSGLYLGDEPDWRDSLRFAFRRLGSVLWLLTIVGVLQAIGIVLCLVPGIWMYGAFAVAMPVLLVEDVRGSKAVRRSVDLVKGRFWPTFGAVFIGALLAGFVQGVFTAPVFVAQAVEANTVVTFLLTATANVAGTALTLPFTAALTTVIYFDLRVRKEGFDLFLLAQRMGVEAPEGGFPKPPGPQPPQPWGAPAFGSAPHGGWYGPPGAYPAPPPGQWQQPPPGGWGPPQGGWQQPPPGSYPAPPGGWSQPAPGSYPAPPGGWSQPAPGSYPAPPGGWSQPDHPAPATEPPPASTGSSGWTEPAGKYVPPVAAESDAATEPAPPSAPASSSAWTEPAGKYVPPDPQPPTVPVDDETPDDGDPG
jgi:hypothetical protein